jgi:hypothetical protein
MGSKVKWGKRTFRLKFGGEAELINEEEKMRKLNRENCDRDEVSMSLLGNCNTENNTCAETTELVF